MILIAILTVTKWAAWQRTKDEEYIKYTVEEGDTLWSIANNLKGDTRKNIYKIRKLNYITPFIKSGQILKLPRF